MNAPKRRDRRSERTREALRRALFDVLFERGWSAVSVHELCRRARVGRSTFYVHFADKEELLLSGFDDLHAELRALSTASAAAPFTFVRPLLEHVRANQHVRALVDKRSGRAVLRRLTQLVVDLIDEDLARLAPAGLRRRTTVQFLAGALVQLVFWWAESGSRLSPAEVARLYRTLSSPVIRELSRA